MAFFRVCQNWEGPTFARLTVNKAAFIGAKFNSLLYKTNRFHVAVHTRLSPRVPLFCSYHILTSFVIYYWTDARQHGIYLLNGCTWEVAKHERSVRVTRGDSGVRL